MTLPNELLSAYLIALEDLLGKNGVNTVLNISGYQEWVESYPSDSTREPIPHAALSKIQETVEDIYGTRTGLNLSRSAARNTLTKAHAELVDIERLKHLSGDEIEKIEQALRAFANLFASDNSGGSTVSRENKQLSISFQDCPNCAGRESKSPICMTYLGWIEGLVMLVDSGVEVVISETTCLATGDDECTFDIQFSQRELAEG
jgi:predicted hydrocarbon binding protein